MPSPLDPVSVQRKKFSDKGLDDHDLVTLVGQLSYIIIACIISVIHNYPNVKEFGFLVNFWCHSCCAFEIYRYILILMF